MSKEVHIVFQVLNFIHSETSYSYNLSDSEKLLLINLASHKGKLGICPSITKIAKERHLEVRAIKYTLKKLSDKKLISIVHKVGIRNSYTLTIPDQVVQQDAPVQPIAPVQSNVMDQCNPTSGPVQPIAPYITKRVTKRITKKDIVHSNGLDQVMVGFEKFWSLYPRKEKKKGALQIWKKLGLEKNSDDINMHLMKRLESDWKGKETRFIPMPTTFLNGERWTDDIPKDVNKSITPKSPENNLMMMVYKHTMGA